MLLLPIIISFFFSRNSHILYMGRDSNNILKGFFFFCPPLAKIQVGVSDLHFWGFRLPPPTLPIIKVGSLQKHFQNHSYQQCTFHAYTLTALCKQTDQNSTKQLGAWQRKEMCNMWLWEVLVGEQPGVYEARKE